MIDIDNERNRRVQYLRWSVTILIKAGTITATLQRWRYDSSHSILKDDISYIDISEMRMLRHIYGDKCFDKRLL